MSEQNDVMSLDELESAGYGYAACATPTAGADPDHRGFSDPPLGKSLFVIKGLSMTKDDVQFNRKVDGEQRSFFLRQLRPRLVVKDGQPGAGGSCLAFIPVPTPQREWCDSLCNEWLQFIHSAGFDLPRDGNGKVTSVWPAGFSFKQLDNRDIVATIEHAQDANGELKLYKGKPQCRVAMYGFERPGVDPSVGKLAPGQPTAKRIPPAKAAAEQQVAQGNFDL